MSPTGTSRDGSLRAGSPRRGSCILGHFRLGLEQQSINSVFLDGFSRIGQREIAASTPERHQIGIVATTRLSALTRGIDGDRAIPVTGVQDLPIARALSLFPRCPVVEAGGIHRVPIARPGQRPEVEQFARPGLLIEGMAEADSVEGAPQPPRGVGTETLRELLARRPNGI